MTPSAAPVITPVFEIDSTPSPDLRWLQCAGIERPHGTAGLAGSFAALPPYARILSLQTAMWIFEANGQIAQAVCVQLTTRLRFKASYRATQSGQPLTVRFAGAHCFANGLKPLAKPDVLHSPGLQRGEFQGL